MAYFNFTSLVRKYSTTFTAKLPSGGEYNASGDWVGKQATEKELTGAIISMRESRILRSEGAYSQQDRALYMLEPLDDALQGAEIIHEGNKYSIGSRLDNGGFTGVWVYVLKFVSVFNGGDVNG